MKHGPDQKIELRADNHAVANLCSYPLSCIGATVGILAILALNVFPKGTIA